MCIRTKNRIYEVESTLSDNGFVKGYNVGEMAFIRKDQVIDQSENLEELCDEGVIEVKFSSTGYIAHFNKNIDELRKFLKYLEECQPITKDEILNVYGAICVDGKGLIYVAKMNENGKLVLI